MSFIFKVSVEDISNVLSESHSDLDPEKIFDLLNMSLIEELATEGEGLEEMGCIAEDEIYRQLQSINIL